MPTDLDLANVSADEDLKVGALADGLASTATDKSSVDDSAVGVANASDSNNGSNNDSSTTNTDNSEANNNGDNRSNDYDFDLKVINATNTQNSTSNSTSTETDDHTKTISINDPKHSYNTDESYNTDSSTHTKDSYNADSSTHVKDSNNTEDSYNADSSTHVKDSNNTFDYTDSSNHVKDSYNSDSSSHLGSLDGVTNSGGIGIAGGDLNFHMGDDYSFNLNLDNVLNHALNGAGNDTGFTLAQANNLADQDSAYHISMNNQGATSGVDGGADPHSDSGYDTSFAFNSHEHQSQSGTETTTTAGHDQSIDASSILNNSGFHQEIVQGANMVSNSADFSITGGNVDHHDTTSNS